MVDWGLVKHFGKAEWRKNPDRVFPALVYLLDEMRDAHALPGLSYVLHVAWDHDGHLEASAHYGDVAYGVDFHMELGGTGLPLLDQWLWAERFPWTGLGLYPWWKHPGLHVDLKAGAAHPALGRRWWQDAGGVYQPVNRTLVRLIVGDSVVA
jgi:hypothetical protein